MFAMLHIFKKFEFLLKTSQLIRNAMHYICFSINFNSTNVNVLLNVFMFVQLNAWSDRISFYRHVVLCLCSHFLKSFSKIWMSVTRNINTLNLHHLIDTYISSLDISNQYLVNGISALFSIILLAMPSQYNINTSVLFSLSSYNIFDENGYYLVKRWAKLFENC